MKTDGNRDGAPKRKNKMKLTKSYLRKIIKEELGHILSEFNDDPDHDDGDEGRGEDPERDARWDKVVADRDAEMRRNPPELGMKGAIARRKKYNAEKAAPRQEGLRRRPKRQTRKRK